ncbi:MAG TPA: hypothetical protein VFR67_26975 [Pilimelia sp.]|nr:hypothetical protein [Pilimelia sp.]
MNPLVARSNLEAHLFMDLRPCGCGDARFERASSVVALPGGSLASRYAGTCARCGTAREFVFALPPQAGRTAAEDIRYGGAEPSELLDAGEWLWTADTYARAVPADPHRLAEPDRRRARARLAAAAAAVDEVLKFVPPGGDRVPEAAVRTPLGGSVYRREPGRFRAARLAAVRDAYRAALRRFG